MSLPNIHPLVVHFPIVLLLFYPLTLGFSLWYKKYNREFYVASLIILALGFLSLVSAIMTGEPLGKDVKSISPQVYQVFERHEMLAEMTRNVVLIALFIHVAAWYLKKYKKKSFSFVPTIHFLLSLLIACGVSLTGSEGGKLTHEYYVGAITCQNTAHPLGNITETLLPLNGEIEKWKKKYGNNTLDPRDLFEELCLKK